MPQVHGPPHDIHLRAAETGYRGVPRWTDPEHAEWGAVVGNRIRRLRRGQGISIAQLGRLVVKPDGGHYSAGYFSKIERGWANAPLQAYLRVADVLGVEPGVLLGPDEAGRVLRPEERVLLEFLGAAGISPGEAVARLSGLSAASGSRI